MEASPNNKTGAFLFGGLIGFVAGLVVAGVLAIWIYNATPFRAETSPPSKLEPVKPKADAKPAVKMAETHKDDAKPDADRVPPPGSSMSSPPPGASVSASSKAVGKAEVTKPEPEPSPSAEPRGRMWLQVGAYINRQDAENQRARFAVLGYEAQIQSADIPDKGPIHRVRIGPYRDPDEAGKVRGDLARQGIEVTVVKP